MLLGKSVCPCKQMSERYQYLIDRATFFRVIFDITAHF